MPNLQTLYARHRPPAEAILRAEAPIEACLTVESALAALENVVARPAFAGTGVPTPENVQAYALALMRLRESAEASGRLRLTRACDALSVTVARLIDQCDAARCDPCAALKRFVVHARAMLYLPAESGDRRTH